LQVRRVQWVATAPTHKTVRVYTEMSDLDANTRPRRPRLCAGAIYVASPAAADWQVDGDVDGSPQVRAF
jgi:hypothetical protein